MDFMKAFDTVPYRRLIHKISQYIRCDTLVDWIENFLHNRLQRVIVNGEKSELKPVTTNQWYLPGACFRTSAVCDIHKRPTEQYQDQYSTICRRHKNLYKLQWTPDSISGNTATS